MGDTQGESRPIRSASALIGPVVVNSVAELDLSEEHAALAKLAELYARELDTAAHVALAADRVLAKVQTTGDVELTDEIRALRNRLMARTALENLGPKLLLALDALNATPKASGRVKVPDAPVADPLAALREARRHA